MSKYDFGYELECGSTNEWAFHAVTWQSDVLELGSSVGNLTKHLAEEKRCRVDIIEIDEEAGYRAAQFANIALIGEKGDLNSGSWADELREQNRKYDHIVILDVLEHLQNPENTLKLAKSLLKETGKLILSIPNAVHNSVLINAFHNKFEYTQLGLLDCTHIHFFAYKDIMEMLQRLKLNIYVLDAVTKAVGTNEIVNSYDSLPEGMEYFLRTRKHAEVYQYLIVSGAEPGSMDDRIKMGISNRSLYTSVVLVNGLGKNEIVTSGTLDFVNIKINLRNYEHVHDIRFLPVGQQCMVKNLTAYGQKENQMVQVHPNWTGGIQVREQDFIFAEGNYEINFQISDTYDTFYIRCSCHLLDSTAAEMFLALKGRMESADEECETMKKQLQTENQELREKTQYLLNENQALKEEQRQLRIENQMLKADQDKLCVKNEILYKEKQNLQDKAARLEADICEYRKLWYVRFKDRMRQLHTEEK